MHWTPLSRLSKFAATLSIAACPAQRPWAYGPRASPVGVSLTPTCACGGTCCWLGPGTCRYRTGGWRCCPACPRTVALPTGGAGAEDLCWNVVLPNPGLCGAITSPRELLVWRLDGVCSDPRAAIDIDPRLPALLHA